MPRVRMNTSVADARHSWDYEGEYEVSPSQAQAWVAAGIAELVTSEGFETPEQRNRGIERRGPGRPRKIR